MKAVRIHAFGGPEVLAVDELAMPVIGDAAVLVKVAAASVNPVDYKIRKGGYPKVPLSALPITLGRDVCGVVAQAGAGVRYLCGAKVYAALDWDVGGYAEYARVPAAFCALQPALLGAVESAAVPLAGLTAWQGLFDYGGLTAGQRVLVHGGAGGVGHFAIQFAKARGAEVFSTAGTDDLDYVRTLGADVAIDYRTQRFEDLAREVDLVFDLRGGETRERSWQVLRRGGILVSTVGPPDEARAAALGVRAKGYMARPSGTQLLEIQALIDAGKVRPTVSKTFTLATAGEAQRCLEADHPRGKIVLAVAP